MEAIKISETKCDILMNKKNEWGMNRIPTMEVGTLGDVGDWATEGHTSEDSIQPAGRPDPSEEVGRSPETFRARRKKRRLQRGQLSEEVSRGVSEAEDQIPPPGRSASRERTRM